MAGEGKGGDSPAQRFVLEPVGWLLGPEFTAQLGKILRTRANPRDWMPYYRGAAHDECWSRDGAIVRVTPVNEPRESGSPGDRDPAPGAERAIEPLPPRATGAESGECWFDYLADTGDAGDSTYAIAYATMISLACTRPVDPRVTWDRNAKPVKLAALPAGAEHTSQVLPAGQFVFIGGDTAYHVADVATLKARLQTPFYWAFADAQQSGHIARDARPDQQIRRIYGIPGNHDWYDNLEGFSQVFRPGAPGRAGRDPAREEPIDLPQLERVQLGSYVAIQLPQGWQLWGLDIDSPLDARQYEYFGSLGVPERLILATPSPAIVFGAQQPCPKHAAAVEALKLGLPPTTQPTYRLDLSGDVHHYARYYPRADGASANGTYGSVVSGLGGAFHHPSFTQLTAVAPDQRVEPERLYPSAHDSRCAVADGLLSAGAAWSGSWLRFIPVLLTVVLGFAATRSTGGAWLLDQVFGLFPLCSPSSRPGGSAALLHAGCALSVLALTIALIVWAVRMGRDIYRLHAEHPDSARTMIDLFGNWTLARIRMLPQLLDPRRSYWLPWSIGAVALAMFGLYPLWGPGGATTALDAATLLIVLAFPVGLAAVGWIIGASGLRWPSRLAIGATGFVHGAAHVVIAMMLARMFCVVPWWRAIAIATATVTLVLLSPRLARPAFRSERRGAALFIALLGLLVLASTLAVTVVAAHERAFESRVWWADAWRLGLAGAAAAPVGTIWFTWYLAIAGRLHGHNNEVGGTARVTRYRQLIRFHIHADGLTGYVIAVENRDNQVAARCSGTNLDFHLIDVFSIPAPAREASLRPSEFLGDIDAGDVRGGASEAGDGGGGGGVGDGGVGQRGAVERDLAESGVTSGDRAVGL